MKQLSEHARTLLTRLYKRPAWSLSGRWGIDLQVVEELMQTGEPAVIPHIAPALLWGSDRERRASSRAIAALLSHATTQDLVWLDERMRGSWVLTYGYGDEWRRLDPQEMARWVGPGEPGVFLLRLSSFHANGFVREEAVRRLARIDDGSELPYLLLRLNDWVRSVRSAAQDAIKARLRNEYIGHFAQNLSLVVRLQRMERTDTELLEAIELLLASTPARPAMVAAMYRGSTESRRAAFRMLVADEPDDLEQLLLAALRATDPIVRLWSLRKAETALSKDGLAAMLDRHTAAPASLVRYEVLQVLARTFPDQAHDRLMGALLDNSPVVRALARFHLRQSASPDLAQVYRNTMAGAGAKRLAGAIAGLAETGAAADAERFLPHVRHSSGRVRRAALAGLMKLGDDRYAHLVLDGVADGARGVSGRARHVLMPHVAALGGAELWDRFAGSTVPHVRRNLVRLMAGLPKWESIRFLVQAAADDDQAVAALAHEYTRRWNAGYNRNQVIPSREQVRLLEAALARAGSRLEPEEASLIRFAVESFSER